MKRSVGCLQNSRLARKPKCGRNDEAERTIEFIRGDADYRKLQRTRLDAALEELCCGLHGQSSSRRGVLRLTCRHGCGGGGRTTNGVCSTVIPPQMPTSGWRTHYFRPARRGMNRTTLRLELLWQSELPQKRSFRYQGSEPCFFRAQEVFTKVTRTA